MAAAVAGGGGGGGGASLAAAPFAKGRASSTRELALLAERAAVADPKVPIARYYRSALELRRQSSAYRLEGDLEAAFLLNMKLVTFIVQSLKKHPQYDAWRGKPECVRAEREVVEVLDECETQKDLLKQLYAAQAEVSSQAAAAAAQAEATSAQAGAAAAAAASAAAATGTAAAAASPATGGPVSTTATAVPAARPGGFSALRALSSQMTAEQDAQLGQFGLGGGASSASAAGGAPPAAPFAVQVAAPVASLASYPAPTAGPPPAVPTPVAPAPAAAPTAAAAAVGVAAVGAGATAATAGTTFTPAMPLTSPAPSSSSSSSSSSSGSSSSSSRRSDHRIRIPPAKPMEMKTRLDSYEVPEVPAGSLVVPSTPATAGSTAAAAAAATDSRSASSSTAASKAESSSSSTRSGPKDRIPDLDDLFDDGRLRPVMVNAGLFDEFQRLVASNTRRNIETCGLLTGVLKRGTFIITTLILPPQVGTSDTVTTTEEAEEVIFDYQLKRGLMTLGWIHTHPKHECFLSSVDMHTQSSYQTLMKEAVAIVLAPEYRPNFGIFRLRTPPGRDGLQEIQNCPRSGFHPHDRAVYEVCQHVDVRWPGRTGSAAPPPFRVVDLRDAKPPA